MNLKVYLLPILLFLQTIYCWSCFYAARFLPYDENYGMILHSFIISLMALIIVLLLWMRKNEWIMSAQRIVLAWVVLGSPLTFLLAFTFYRDLFGTALAN
ncbi:MAG TPA: hypothetical protein VNB90_08270 [Cytophagaceae bacterium]|jgi:hypothetical protein|nr:hypothetical protein [Cytophagaceae bacterium]